MSIQVIIADDHKLIRQGLASLLARTDEIVVVGQANNGREAVQLTEKHRPDLVVMDVSMPDLNGIDATRQILARSPNTRIIALSMHSDRQFVAEMFRAGARGYLLKDSAFEELANAIHKVVHDEVYLAPKLNGFKIEDYAPGQEPNRGSMTPRLSDREREVLQLMAEGNGTKESAAKLHLSPKTVETHRQHLMDKLGMYSVAELTKFAIREGLTTLDQ
jgi:DNA-binding NarL/FixJ family response regulator